MKILRFISNNFLFLITLFLLAFIPLYPKLPIVNVQHTWVYIRAEDFIVTLVVILWIFLLLLKKVTLKTPLTLPIILFWLAGGIATLHGVLFIFPTLSDVFSNVAFLSFLRRIEYIFLFFIAFTSIKEKKFISYVTIGLAVTLLLVVGYGLGQKFLGFPAYLTMNEEFAKGVPIQLSELSRIPSTFAGHYDLAAYLVLIVPLITSMVFGFKNWFVKMFLLGTAALGFVLLAMTVSRVSFFVLLISMVVMLILQKKRLLIISLFLIVIVFLSFSSSLLQRFGNTLKEVNVLVDVNTGGAIGEVKEVPAKYFENKIVKRQFISNEEAKLSSASAILPFSLIPPVASLIVEPNSPTGENLPQGTSYVNLPLSPITKKVQQFFYQKSNNRGGIIAEEITVSYGDFVMKKALAYDLSFTTRFQGEWPKTLLAFTRSIFLGSGYGSVSLAVDNNYLRILGETGAFGFISFLSIFLIAGIYIKKILPNVDSPIVRSFILGFIAGTFGLLLNALLIDVFEASKIAFTYWLLMGVTLGTLELYRKEEIDLYQNFKKVVISTYAIIIYLFTIMIGLFSSAFGYYFVGDDFTWFRWIVDCYSGAIKNGLQQCQPFAITIIQYFTQADGFFYRPGAKLYFDLMYSVFWLNQSMYHFVSFFLHFSVAVLVFLISKRILKNYFLAIVSGVFFLILSGGSEAIFWISSTGFLFNAMFALLGLLFFIYWKERGKIIYLVISCVSIALSLLFHELGIMAPFLVILYDTVFGEKSAANKLSRKSSYLFLLSPILPYLILRLVAGSHWFNGDYSYNLLKLPYNIIGNAIGYIMLTFFGPASLSFYEGLRNFSRAHSIFAIVASLIMIFLIIKFYRLVVKNIDLEEEKIVTFGFLFFILALLPFLGLGNIASRYSYLSSFGLMILFVFFLKKAYGYLLFNGKYIAMSSVVLIAIIFSMAQLFQLQKLSSDWRVAGEKSQNFLISLNKVYTEDWAKEHVQLYFVDTPIRNGEAWIFPVGLPDAIWLTVKNNNLSIFQPSNLQQALDQAGTSSNAKVLKFDSDGNITEVFRVKTQ
ncbi:MAG: O-antigen ligase family protein [Candidatus Levybacteria bacterium]|nr:O-antigen ligase family protein [Candidatus Levybacteria bacterium]